MKDRIRWIAQVLLFPFQVILALFMIMGNEIIHFVWNLTGKKK